MTRTSMLTLTYGTNLKKTNLFTNLDEVIPETPDLEDFWNVESIGVIDKRPLSNYEKAENVF